jgi:uncharacterized protein (TIGR02421 family)
VLGRLSWREGAVETFLERWRKGDRALPSTAPAAVSLAAEREVFQAVIDAVDEEDPAGAFVARTARSYASAAELVEAAGTPRFVDVSRELYGGPRDPVAGTTVDHVHLARRLLEVTGPLMSVTAHEQDRVCLTPHYVRDHIAAQVDEIFGVGVVPVVVDDDLASKAAASVNRIRLRGRTSFSLADIDQLVAHEAAVHVATAKNGLAQPTLTALSLGAPRTTATQEGLATIAELLTGAIDLSRLRRLALRIEAVGLGLDGADFLDVFEFFLEHGQSEDESARSAMRVFRGGDVRGRVVFTKDVVYLYGLVAVHTFLRRAIVDGRVELVARLFAGRMTLGDVLALEPVYDEGRIVPPTFMPSWASDLRRLAASLSFSAAINVIDLEGVRLDDL